MYRTYQVHIQVANLFEDVLVKARNENEAIRKAKKVATLKHHFASYMVG